MEFDLEGTDARAPGMICGGTATLLVDFVAPTPGNAHSLENITALLRKQDFYSLTILRASPEGDCRWRSLLRSDGTLTGLTRGPKGSLSE